MLADLCKLERETAATLAAGDTKPPPNVGLTDAEPMSSEEFDSFMQSLQQSKNIIHDPISLAIYNIFKQGDQSSQQLQPVETLEQQKNANERRGSKPAPLQQISQLSVQQPPSLSIPLSMSYVSIHITTEVPFIFTTFTHSVNLVCM